MCDQTKKTDIRFLFPINGDCLNSRDGKQTDAGMLVSVSVEAPQSKALLINGVPAVLDQGVFYADVLISGYHTVIEAQDPDTECFAEIAVFYLSQATMKYRISSDDNILFLQDINEKKNVYKSIFENPYLALYKKAHDLYGACVHLNLFYAFPADHKRFSGKHTDFNLSMMTDRFKDEWQKNADWLKLSFHAWEEYPSKPYQFAKADRIMKDCIAVNREIIRFAGKEVLPDVTTIHWGETTPECARALRTAGYRMLTGYFERTPDGAPMVSYYVPDELVDHIGERDFWIDTKEDIQFGRIDLVLNTSTHAANMEEMKRIIAHPHRGGFVSIMIHEQYFYPDYVNYLPDFEDRLLEPCRLLWESGYDGTNICDVIQEQPLCERF